MSDVNGLATESNNIGEYTALTDSAVSQAEAWSSLSCLNCINFEWIFSRFEVIELFDSMNKTDFGLFISFRYQGLLFTSSFSLTASMWLFQFWTVRLSICINATMFWHEASMVCDVIEHKEEYCMKLLKFTYFVGYIQHTNSD